MAVFSLMATYASGEVRHRPFQMGADVAGDTLGMQAIMQGGFGGGQLAEQRLPPTFNRHDFAGIHNSYENRSSILSGYKIELSLRATWISDTQASSRISAPGCFSA